ncbi:hypothetical protein FGD77_01395 [Roseovarius sp. M141]|nr:hypothetical protein [Roseovarius sp. M141]
MEKATRCRLVIRSCPLPESTPYLGRALWRRLSGYHRRSRVETNPLDGVDAPSRHRCAKVAVSKRAMRRKRPWKRLAL